MTREATFASGAIRRQFSELAGLLENELTVYLIGGGALTLDDLKNATKDIDLIVRERDDLDRLWQVLTAAGYNPEEDLFEEYDVKGSLRPFPQHRMPEQRVDDGAENVCTVRT